MLLLILIASFPDWKCNALFEDVEGANVCEKFDKFVIMFFFLCLGCSLPLFLFLLLPGTVADGCIITCVLCRTAESRGMNCSKKGNPRSRKASLGWTKYPWVLMWNEDICGKTVCNEFTPNDRADWEIVHAIYSRSIQGRLHEELNALSKKQH